MPEISPEIADTPDVQWSDIQFNFDGKWMPDIDPALVGPDNYAAIENVRYRDSGLSGVNGYTKINTTALTTYTDIRNGAQLRSSNTQKTYTLVHAANPSGDQGRVYVNRTDIGSQGDFDTTHKFDVNGNAYYADSETGLTGRFSSAPQGNLAYANSKESMIFGGDESQVAAAFIVQDASGTNPVDVTDDVNNSLQSSFATMQTADYDYMLVFTTRPIQGLKFYLVSGSTPGTVAVNYWDGNSWTATANATDNTTGFTSTGTYVFDHTDSVVQPLHFEELFLYAYQVVLSGAGGDADIYRITVDTAFQTVKDIWDGVYRQPIQLQKLDGTTYADYTLQVNVASSLDAPVGADIAGLTTGEHIILMFEEQVSAARITMLGNLVNSAAASTLKVSYWNGSGYTALTSGTHNYVDGTTDGTKPFSQTGLVSWVPPSDEKPKTLFSSFGYAYKLEVVTANVSGTKNDKTVFIDLVSGVPSQKIVKPFDFTAEYQNRLMLCSYSAGNEANRIDYSVTNAPDVFNGTDSSDDGRASLYFGGEEGITAARSLYNRFGSNILSMFLVLKDAETYLLVGSDPSNFTIYPVSKSIGCPAPLTLATADISLGDGGEQTETRNMAFWLSGSGPVMFDGASISSIRGVENFFNPNSTEYIEWDNIARSRGWIDTTYNEYNLMIPSTSSQADVNRWLVYDLTRRKWFEKIPTTYPQAAWEVLSEEGERNVYGGIDSGFMMHLENGASWAGAAIQQRIRTGDFFPSNNIWEETIIRKIKLLTKKFENTSTVNILDIYHYPNTEEPTSVDIVWQVANTETGHAVNYVDGNGIAWVRKPITSITVNQDIGTRRLLNIILDANKKGWAHAFEFIVNTTDVANAFRPVAWGVQYRVEKKNNQASSG